MFCNMGIKTKGQSRAGVIQRTAGRRPERDDGSQIGFQARTKNSNVSGFGHSSGPERRQTPQGQRDLTFRELWTADSGG